MEICDKHFPDLKRRVPEITRRVSTDTERLKNANQKEVRERLRRHFYIDSEERTLNFVPCSTVNIRF